ncbi:UvrD-helicase domain-containing protein [Pectobacterium brasiliense]|uniref:UvrD-helicase domain-containing protein n=2 Tax=Pectobacterium TaxID=122277 RepID=A0AAW9H695_9GAMM|nr:UvrD-helicase domain-containing protein [Pectobacterium brasiliense]MDY4379702.1 UvrD-helicase domain-containing protein [Pectobacterium brasiliense]
MNEAAVADADNIIQACLNLTDPKSFFLYAGAGSGKTHSLVEAIRELIKRERERLTFEGRRIAVITYTNAACDEIIQRLEFDPLVEVSTIHAFAWRLIQGFDNEIREWLRIKLGQDIEKIEGELARSRGENKTSRGNRRKLQSKIRRLETLDEITKFIYSPTGDNRELQALNHDEVIKLTAAFAPQHPLLDVLVDRYPIVLIDESQDTHAPVMEAFLKVQQLAQTRFCLGLLGDTMQQIYGHGVTRLDKAIPSDWLKPEKLINHRCPRRVVDLINVIRSTTDTHQQTPKPDAIEGVVRMYCVSQNQNQAPNIEENIAHSMAAITNDSEWTTGPEGRKTLILEHKMAGRRMGFEKLFTPLYAVEHLQTGLLDGTLPALRVFSEGVLPILTAKDDHFLLLETVRSRSPLLSKDAMQSTGDQSAHMQRVEDATHALLALFERNDPTLLEVATLLLQTQLLNVNENLVEAMALGVPGEAPDSEDTNAVTNYAYQLFLERPFSELTAFASYADGLSPYGTHQGVKGLEFPRVMVVINDEEAGGFLFSYDKLLGVKEPTKTDRDNERDGKDNALARTRRLLYVTCSRAENSLAIVVYTPQPSLVKRNVVDAGWLQESEVEIL